MGNFAHIIAATIHPSICTPQPTPPSRQACQPCRFKCMQYGSVWLMCLTVTGSHYIRNNRACRARWWTRTDKQTSFLALHLQCCYLRIITGRFKSFEQFVPYKLTSFYPILSSIDAYIELIQLRSFFFEDLGTPTVISVLWWHITMRWQMDGWVDVNIPLQWRI